LPSKTDDDNITANEVIAVVCSVPLEGNYRLTLELLKTEAVKRKIENQ